MILDPINDRECLDQLTKIARELVPTTLIREVARRLGSRAAVVRWFQSLPQDDDNGSESVRFIQCDVPQRVRLLPDTPNCVERSLGAAMLLEVVDPDTPRALATIDKPLRHTGLVEKQGAHWRAVDLFPRRNAKRNFNWGEFGKDVLQGIHTYVGKPVLTFYGMGSVADTIGDYEDKAIGREKKKQPEKKGTPPPDGNSAKPEQPKPQRQPQQQKHQQPPQQQLGAAKSQQSKFGDLSRLLAGAGSGAGATSPIQPTPNGGGKDGEKKEEHHSGAAALDGAAGGASPPRDGGHQDGVQADHATSSEWWFLGR